MATLKDYRIRIEAKLDPASMKQVEASFKNLGSAIKQVFDGAFGKTFAEQRKVMADSISHSVKLAKNGAAERAAQDKKYAQEAKAALNEHVAAVTAAEMRLTKARQDGARDKAIRQAEADLAKAKLKFVDESIAATKREYAERIRLAKGNAAEQLRLETDLTNNLAKQESARGRAAKAFELKMRGAKKDPTEMGENFATISTSLQSGDIAGVAGLLGGPLAGGIGVAVDALVNLGGAFIKAGEASLKVQGEYTKLQAIFTNQNINVSIGQMQILEKQLNAIQRPAGMSREAIVQLAQSLAGFEEPEALAETTEAVINLSRLQPSIDTKTLGQDLSDLEAGAGSITAAADMAAAVASKIQGDSIAPLSDAVGGLVQGFNKAKLAIDDQEAALHQAGVAFTALTAAGLSTSEATAGTEKIFKGLQDAINDPTTLKTLTKALPEGFDLVANGLEQGNLDIVKFVGALEKMGPEADAVTAILGPKLGGEALATLKNAFDQTGISIAATSAELDKSAGAAARSAALMVPLSQRLDEIKNQKFDDISMRIGDQLSGGLMSAKQAAVDFLDTVSTADLGPFNGLKSLFFDMSVEAERANTAFEAALGVSQAFGDLAGELASTPAPEFLSSLETVMPQIEATSAGAAAEIQALADNAQLPEAEKIARINEIMTQISQSTAAEAMSKLADVVETTSQAVDQLLSESSGIGSFFDSFIEGAGQLLSGDIEGLGETMVSGVAAQMGNLDQMADVASMRVARLNEDWKAASGNIEEQRRIAVELNAARNSLTEIEGNRASIVEQTTELWNTQLAAQEQMAIANGEVFNREEAIAQLRSGASDQLVMNAELMAEITANVTEQASATEELAGAQETQLTAAEQLTASQASMNEAVNAQLATSRELGVQDSSQAASKAQAAEASIQQNNQLIGQLKAQIAIDQMILDGQISQEEAAARKAELIANQNQLLEDQNAIAAGGEGSGAVAMAAAGGDAKAEASARIAAANEQIKQLEQLNEDTKRFIETTNESSVAAKEKAQADKGAAKEAKELEKQAKAAAKAEKDAAKTKADAAKDLAESNQKAMDAQIAAQQKRDEEYHKARMAREEAARKAMEDYSKALDTFASERAQEFRSIASESAQAIQSRRTARFGAAETGPTAIQLRTAADIERDVLAQRTIVFDLLKRLETEFGATMPDMFAVIDKGVDQIDEQISKLGRANVNRPNDILDLAKAREDATAALIILARLQNETLTYSSETIRTATSAAQAETAIDAATAKADAILAKTAEIAELQKQGLAAKTSEELNAILAKINTLQTGLLESATEVSTALDSASQSAQAFNDKALKPSIDAATDYSKALTDIGIGIENADEKLGEHGAFLSRNEAAKATADAATEVSNRWTKAAEDVGKATSSIAAGISGAINFATTMSGTGDAGEKASAGADLISQVGSTFMDVAPGTPLALVGAFMVGGAEITKALVGLARLMSTRELTLVEKAEQRARAEERVRAIKEAQANLMSRLVALGQVEVDQAWERVRAEQAMLNTMTQQSDLARDLAMYSNEELANIVKGNEITKKANEDKITEAELAIDRGLNAREQFIIDNNIGGFGTTTERITQWMNDLKAQNIDYNEVIETGNAILDSRGSLMQAQSEALEEQIALNNLVVKLGGSETVANQKNLKLRREALDAALKTIGVNTTGMSQEALLNTLKAQAQVTNSQLSPAIQGLITGWMEAAEAAGVYGAEVEDLYERQLSALQKQRELGKITNEEYFEQSLELMQERLALEQEELDNLIEQDATAGTILDQRLAVMDIELAIKNLLDEQNGELSKSDKILTKLVRDRQRMKAAGASSSQIQAQNRLIEDQLRASGRSEDEIAEFMATLPQFAEGGFHPKDAAIAVHAGEVTIPKSLVDQVGRGAFEDAIRTDNPMSLMNSPAAKVVMQGLMTEKAAQLNALFNTTVNNNMVYNGVSEAQLLTKIADLIERQTPAVVQKAITAGLIDVRR